MRSDERGRSTDRSPGAAQIRFRESRLGDGSRLVAIDGELDVFTAGAELEELFEECVDSASHLLVDMSEVSFIDSSGLGLLVKTERRLSVRGRRLVVLSPHENVRSIFEMTGLNRWLTLDSWSEGQALPDEKPPPATITGDSG